MDPTTTAELLAAALTRNGAECLRSDTWNARFDALLNWLERGGFPPKDDALSTLLDELDNHLPEHYNALSDALPPSEDY